MNIRKGIISFSDKKGLLYQGAKKEYGPIFIDLVIKNSVFLDAISQSEVYTSVFKRIFSDSLNIGAESQTTNFVSSFVNQ
ncbi:MAG: hypothetical protein P9M03_07855 [Candidatus Theseobacter exili]|nr:hypothetical protein [Candidatus Theseobacter exili]